MPPAAVDTLRYLGMRSLRPTAGGYASVARLDETAQARILHEYPAASAHIPMSTALRSLGLLNVLPSTPAVASVATPCIHRHLHRHLHRFATNTHAIFGLKHPLDASPYLRTGPLSQIRYLRCREHSELRRNKIISGANSVPVIEPPHPFRINVLFTESYTLSISSRLLPCAHPTCCWE
jgi:hypothetical protein